MSFHWSKEAIDKRINLVAMFERNLIRKAEEIAHIDGCIEITDFVVSEASNAIITDIETEEHNTESDRSENSDYTR